MEKKGKNLNRLRISKNEDIPLFQPTYGGLASLFIREMQIELDNERNEITIYSHQNGLIKETSGTISQYGAGEVTTLPH
jgi:hypothetical protein